MGRGAAASSGDARAPRAAPGWGTLPAMSTAALLVIGNEILSGKVRDTNSAFLAVELRKLV